MPALQALMSSRHEVLGVLTRPDARSGRGRRSGPSPVREVAEDLGLPVSTPSGLRGDDVRKQLQEWAPDACAVVAYGALVPAQLLALPPHGWVNLHFSLLPAWRGAAPVQHAVMAGDDVTGAVTFVLEEGLDTGPVLGRLTESIRPRDTSGDLLQRLACSGAELLVATFDALEEGALLAEPQSAQGVSHAPKLQVEDARVDWATPAFAVDRFVRGVTPAPGAWTLWRGERLKVQPVTPAEHVVDPLGPGEIRAMRHEVLVGTASTPVVLGKVQPHGKRLMAAADWARGVRPEEGERLSG